MTVPALQVFSGVPFRWVLLGTGAAAGLLALLWRLAKTAPAALPELLRVNTGGTAVLALSALALLLGAAYTAGKSAVCFPQTETSPWTGLLVLALAALAAHGGIETLLRCGGILAAALTALLGTVLVFSAPQIEPRNLAPAGGAGDALRVFLLALLPSLGLYFHGGIVRTQKRPALWLGALVALPTAAAAITGGCLSARIAAQPQPFRLLAQSVSILGVMQRFEALSYGAELSGFFLLCALLLFAAGRCAAALLPFRKQAFAAAAVSRRDAGGMRVDNRRCRLRSWFSAKNRRELVLALLAAALVYPSQGIPLTVFCVLTGLFCGLLPLGILWVEKIKNFAKILKNS